MEDYDRLCVRSWIDSGFRILSLNDPDEIPALAARHKEVAFIPAGRNASALFGRRTPFIGDVLAALAGAPEPVLGIINSDLLFEPASGWSNLESLVARKAVVTGQRYDVRTLAGGALHRYVPGFDYFFFDHAAAADLAEDGHPFSMGLPWWDYWLPLTLALKGYDIRCVGHPAVLHLAHESRTEARSPAWRRLALACARSIVRTSETSGHNPPSQWSGLLALCRELAQESDDAPEGGALDGRIISLSALSVPIIAGAHTALADACDVEPRETSVPPAYFADIPKRFAAGQALHQALWEESQERLDAAQSLYWTALENAPEDPGVLSACGNYLFRRGDMGRAAMLLGKAVERAPHSSTLLNSLGSAFGGLGRDDLAIGCFEKALAADPLDGTSYYNLAIALHPRKRHGEIISLLEDRVRDRPEFPDGPQWLSRIREKFSQLESLPGF